MKFYKSQLSEIEKDILKGSIGIEEAEQLKVEISRRILKVKSQSFVEFSSQSASSGLKLALVLGVFTIVLSLGLYLSLGSLGYLDFSQKTRIKEAKILKESTVNLID